MKKTMIAVALTAALIQACGGGGSSSSAVAPSSATSISGVAAAGAPLAGSVTIKDSAGVSKTVQIGTNGSYSVDVSDMTAPFMFRAEGSVGGRSYVMYSAATDADINGNINITPFTDLIIANMAGQLAESYFNSGNFSGLTSAELDAQETLLQERLQAVFTAIGIDSSIDILRSSFVPDHTQLDAALDILRVDVDTTSNIATITNILTNEQITDDITSSSDVTALTDTTNITAGLTDLQAITLTFDSFNALYATSLPTQAQVEAHFDAAFLNNDQGGATTAADITSDPSMIGFRFADIAISNLDPVAHTATVEANIYFGGQFSHHLSGWQLKMDASTGKWLFLGNQRIVDLSFTAHMLKNFVSGTPFMTTGVELWLENPNVNNDGGTITSVVVSGPGLGSNGITYQPQVSYPSGNYLIASSDVCRVTTPPLSYCLMDNDSDITAIPDGAQYTIKVYVDGNTTTPVATYTQTLAKRPFTNAELNSVAWPVVTQESIDAFTNYSGGAITITATLPDGVTSTWGRIGYTDSNNVYDYVDQETNGASSSVSMSANFTIANPPIIYLETHLAYSDMYNREIGVMATR